MSWSVQPSIPMAVNENPTWETVDGEENDDALSFCYLSIVDKSDPSLRQSPRISTDEEFFQFHPPTPAPRLFYTHPHTIFGNEDDRIYLNEYQKSDHLSITRSKSFRRSPPGNYSYDPLYNNARNHSSSSRDLLGSIGYSISSKYAAASNHVRKVNITSLTSMSAKSRRRMFMFGPVKFEPEMELSSIKQRQGRRVPTTMFPAAPAGGDGVPVVDGGGSGKTGGKTNRWRMLRLFRGRAHLTDVLAWSFGCSPLSMSALAQTH